jgi:shikimate kinase
MATHPSVVLIGPPAAGKSRIGRKVARYLHRDFIDTDSVIVAEHGPIAEIFRDRGEPAFRTIEREVVARALATDAVVVSLGGGAVLDEQTRLDLRNQRVALLTMNADAAARRISGQRRPLLAAETGEDRLAAWQQLLDARRSIYEGLATRSWDTSERPITAIAEEIAEWAGTDRAGTGNR